MATYYFDGNLPLRFAQMLRALDVPVEHLLETKGDAEVVGLPDQDWLARLQDKGHVLVTIDRAINKRSATALALQTMGITVILLPLGFEKLNRWDQATWLVKNWRAIDAHVAHVEPGAWAQAALTGQIAPLERE